MTKLSTNNPFIFAKPVPPDKFIGREYELNSVLNRVLEGGSYLITGQPRIGKSSLFQKVSSLILKSSDENKTFIPVPITRVISSSSFIEQDFFRHVIKSINGTIDFTKGDNESDDFLEFIRFLERLSAENKQVVLLVDGLGWLLEKVGMNFWIKMRVALQASNLVFVAFSRLNFQQISEKTTDFARSPFINILFSHSLTPFSEKQTNELIDTYNEKHYFTPKDKRIVWQLSGGHPFLAQISSSLIWERRINSQSISKDGYKSLFDEILDVARPHFWDTWRYLTPSEQTIGLMLSIRDLAQINNFDVGELDNVLKYYQNDIQTLRQTGLMRIENEKIYLSSLCFGLWITQNQVFGKDIKGPDEFLRENLKIVGSLTNKQLDSITNTTAKILSSFKNTAINVVDVIVRSKLGLPPT